MLVRFPWRLIPAFLIGALLVLVAAWTLGLLPSVYVNYCYENQSGHKECAAYNIALVAFWETGKVLNWISPAITAFATIAIAYFTFTLKESSDKLFIAAARSAEAARQSAVAAISAERPRVQLSKLRFSRGEFDIRDRTKLPIITIGFKNYGRTVAVVSDLRIVMQVINELPSKPDYGEGRVYVPVGKTIEPREEWVMEKWFSGFTQDVIGTEPYFPFKAHFWVYGYIEYRDHIGGSRRHGFVGLWIPPDVGSNVGSSGENFIWGAKEHYAYDT
jgi:hypothetical protein